MLNKCKEGKFKWHCWEWLNIKHNDCKKCCQCEKVQDFVSNPPLVI